MLSRLVRRPGLAGCLLLAGSVPLGCLRWYAPDLSRKDAPHSQLQAGSTDAECLSCHRPLGADGRPLQDWDAFEEDHRHHAAHHAHHPGHEKHLLGASAALDRGTSHAHAPAEGPWFPSWMLEEEQPCVGCHAVR